MRILKSLFIAVVLTISISSYSIVDFNDKKIEVYFSNKLDFNELVRMKLDLSQKQIIVNYQVLEFDKTGKLKAIGFEVISEGKYCGSGKTDNLSKDYGFSIDRSPNAAIYFNVGLTR